MIKKAETPVPPPKGWKKWSFWFTACVLIPILFFFLMEMFLRMVGYGYQTDFFLKIPGQESYSTNQKYGLRFFPQGQSRFPLPCELPAKKPKNTYRIFILGGSAAMGMPNPAFAASRFTEVMLKARFPNINFEVINTAMTAINSHVVHQIARECAEFEPDLFVIYMGNNEVVGPYGSGTVFKSYSPSTGFIRFTIFIRKFRIIQLLDAAIKKIRTLGHPPVLWKGMEMFLGNQVAWNDTRMDGVYASFQKNLSDILQYAHNVGSKVILCTVPTNLKDNPPFASQHRAELNQAEKKEWQKNFIKGIALEKDQRYEQAVKH